MSFVLKVNIIEEIVLELITSPLRVKIETIIIYEWSGHFIVRSI